MANDPEIAVVIGAYRRATYLLDAVRSVLAQTLPRDRYEIVVVKGFDDPAIDAFLAAQEIASRRDADPCIGTWLLGAVRMTRAPILALLDDDDVFEPDRLAQVLEVFHAHPDVGFYRNRVRVMDATGAAVPEERWRSIEADAAFDATGPVFFGPAEKRGLVDVAFRRTRSSFNSSTMVVRRALLEGAYADRFAPLQLPDLALIVFGAVGPFGVYLDDRRLTRYRSYAGNVTGAVPWLAYATTAHRALAGYAKENGAAELAGWLEEFADHYDRMYLGGRVVEAVGRGAERRLVARYAADYLRYLGAHPRERAATFDVWASAMYGLGYLMAPGPARRLAGRRPTGARS
jgi:glycosyltransferase involved in cell wall biosynthesis